MEDRHSVHYLGPHGLLVAVFDGHSGYKTSDVLSFYLASYVERELNALSASQRTDTVKIADAFTQSFLKFDADLTENVPVAAIKVGSEDAGTNDESKLLFLLNCRFILFTRILPHPPPFFPRPKTPILLSDLLLLR